MLIGLTHQHRFWFLKWYRNGDVHRFSAVFFHRFTCSCVYGVSSHVLIGYVENGPLFILCFLWSQLCHEPTFVFMNYRQFWPCVFTLWLFFRFFWSFLRVKILWISFLFVSLLINHKLLFWSHGPFQITSLFLVGTRKKRDSIQRIRFQKRH